MTRRFREHAHPDVAVRFAAGIPPIGPDGRTSPNKTTTASPIVDSATFGRWAERARSGPVTATPKSRPGGRPRPSLAPRTTCNHFVYAPTCSAPPPRSWQRRQTGTCVCLRSLVPFVDRPWAIMRQGLLANQGGAGLPRIARLRWHGVALALHLGHERLREPTPLRFECWRRTGRFPRWQVAALCLALYGRAPGSFFALRPLARSTTSSCGASLPH